MSGGRKIAIMAVVGGWCAFLYSITWFFVSTFVSADVISHYYADMFLSRWWSALFIPAYSILTLAIYFWIIKRWKIGIWSSFAVGLTSGILLSAFDAILFLDQVFFYILCIFSSIFIISFLLFFWKIDRLRYLLDVVISFILFGVLGLALGLSCYVSFLGVLMVCGFTIFVMIMGMLIGGGVVLAFSSILSALVWLHKLAFGIKDKNREE